jgi:hypothetical protein
MRKNKNPFEGIYTFAEAAQLWGLADSTLRQANHTGRFLEGEIKQAGKVWLITREAMERLYGPQPDPEKEK